MATFAIRLDPSGTPLTITSDPYFLTSLEAPEPGLRSTYVSAFGVDGAQRVGSDYENRTITVELRIVGSSASDLEDRVQTLQAAITKMHREGGVLELTTPANTVVNATVLDANMTVPLNKRYISRLAAEPTLTFTCKPLLYGTEVGLAETTETTASVLTFTQASIAGDVPGLGRLVVDEDQAASQNWLAWGLRSRNYSSSADQALFYEAEGRTLQGAGATTATSATVFTGASYVIAGSLSTSFESILSSQASGGGNHLAHTGRYRVFGRFRVPTANTGTVSVALEWAVGDFRNPTTNEAVALTTANGYAAGSWNLVDLGIVNVPAVLTGSQRWEARFLAKSTVLNDDVLLDHFYLFPVDEGYGEVAAQGVSAGAPTSYTARDDFSSGTYSGDLVSDTLVTGGTWTAPASPYETDDFAVTGGVARRNKYNDASTDARYGRWLYASGTSALTNTVAQVDITSSYQLPAGQVATGLVLRAVDKNSFLAVYIDQASPPAVKVVKAVSGTVTVLQSVSVSYNLYSRLRARVLADGSYSVYRSASWSKASLTEPTVVLSGYDADLATGGTLDDGYVGLFDWCTNASAGPNRDYDDFLVYAPVVDAACFASRSLQVRYDGVIRQDSAGAIYQPVSSYEGDYLLVPPAGRESRTTEIMVKMSRGVPGVGADSAFDDVSAKLYVTPRYLTIPT